MVLGSNRNGLGQIRTFWDVGHRCFQSAHGGRHVASVCETFGAVAKKLSKKILLMHIYKYGQIPVSPS